MNDFLGQAVQALRQGRDPMPILQAAARQNPQIAQVLQMGRGGSLQQAAQQMAQQRGIDLNALVRQMMGK